MLSGIVNINLTLDRVEIVDRLEKGEVIRPVSTVVQAGGKGVNIARIFKLLGHQYEIIGFFGGLTGSLIENELNKEKIKYFPVMIDGESRNSIIIINKKNKSEVVINEKGPVVSISEINKFIKHYKNFIKDKKYIIITGSYCRGIPDDFYFSLIEIAHKKRKIVFLDTSGIALFKGLEASPDIIKPNIDELSEIVDKKIDNIKEIKRYIKKIISKFKVIYVIVSMGKKGAMLGYGGNFYRITPPVINAISSVGSGDAMVAGFISEMEKTNDVMNSFRFSVACGMANAVNLLPGHCNKKLINKYYRSLQVEVV